MMRLLVSSCSFLLGALPFLAAVATASKRGFAVNDGIDISKAGDSSFGFKSKISWTYNWDSTTNNKQGYAEFVPMLWGTKSYHTNQWDNNANYWVSKGSRTLLGFNEPDRPDQANISPAAAVSAWRKYMDKYAGKARLGASAVSNGGYNWLKDFLNQCSGCHIDFVPVHWYNDHTQENDLENWVNKICSAVGNRKIWLTEFKGFGSIDQQRDFIKKAMPFLDSKTCVERYSYFGTANDSKDLLLENGPYLSALGTDYCTSESPPGPHSDARPLPFLSRLSLLSIFPCT